MEEPRNFQVFDSKLLCPSGVRMMSCRHDLYTRLNDEEHVVWSSEMVRSTRLFKPGVISLVVAQNDVVTPKLDELISNLSISINPMAPWQPCS